MGISTSPSKPWAVIAAALILIWSVIVWVTLRDPIPAPGLGEVPSVVLAVIGLVIAAVLAFNVFGPEDVAWTGFAAIAASAVGLGVAALMASSGTAATQWAVLLMGVGSTTGLVALFLEQR